MQKLGLPGAKSLDQFKLLTGSSSGTAKTLPISSRSSSDAITSGSFANLKLTEADEALKEEQEAAFEGTMEGKGLPGPADSQLAHERFPCKHCAGEVELPVAQEIRMKIKYMTKVKSQLAELTKESQRRASEHEQVKRFINNKNLATSRLQEKVKKLKEEHSQLAKEARELADSVPELTKIVSAVQLLVAEREEFKEKYLEEQKKRKKLFNAVQEAIDGDLSSAMY